MSKKNKIQNIILHAGILKTASTSIQYTLYTNEMPEIYSKKYYYPKAWSDNHGVILTQIVGIDDYNVSFPELHATLVKGFSPSLIKTIEEHTQSFLKEVTSFSFETLIISAEVLSIMQEKDLFRVKDFLKKLIDNEQVNIQLVAYSRNPISLLNSSFQNNVKRGYHFSYDNVDEYSQLISQHIPAFVNVFGKENVKFYKMENAIGHEYGPVGFFYEKILGFDQEEIAKIKIQKGNSSFSQIAVDLCTYINKTVPFYDHKKQTFSNLRSLDDLELIGKKISGPVFKLSKEVRYNHLKRCKAQTAYLKEVFGIDYSNEEMKEDIDGDSEPCHIPSENNIMEINNIFKDLNKPMQDCVINYLTNILEELSEYLVLHQEIKSLLKSLAEKQTELME